MAEQDQRPIKGYPDSMGPDIRSGGVQVFGGLVPPYGGRKTHTSRAEAEKMASVYTVDYSNPAAPREISEIERNGVPATDTTARNVMGVGRTTGRQGNELALGDGDRHRHRARRPIDPAYAPLQP
ncbi:MAG TPA: hypothetical protein VGJ13_11985 [Pseudonocardiaceae bacterium]